MPSPFNPQAHDFLVNNGYTHVYDPASWEDVGGPENGPKVIGGPAVDIYDPVDRTQHAILIDENGSATLDTMPGTTYDYMDAMCAEQF